MCVYTLRNLPHCLNFAIIKIVNMINLYREKVFCGYDKRVDGFVPADFDCVFFVLCGFDFDFGSEVFYGSGAYAGFEEEAEGDSEGN